MLQGEHSAILSTFIKLPFSIKTFVLHIFEWLLQTGFTVSAISYFTYLTLLYCQVLTCIKTNKTNETKAAFLRAKLTDK